ncbi:MAG: tetratricopeptide repeat protein [Methylomonas sp.]|jgi:tetratricopeptide (TPR) repeat protein
MNISNLQTTQNGLIDNNEAACLSLPISIAEAYRCGQGLIAALKREAYVLLDNSQNLPDGLLAAKQSFVSAQARVVQQITELNNKLTTEELQALNALQDLIKQMSTASIDGLIEANPDVTDFRYERAGILLNQGRDVEALNDFQAVLTKDPTHFGALNTVGQYFMENGRHGFAHKFISQAVQAHPDIAIGHLNLADLLIFQSDYALAKQHYQTAIELEPSLTAAHQGLALALAGLGDESGAAAHRELGFRGQAVITWAYRGQDEGIPLIVLSSAFGGNISIKHVLDKRIFHSSVILTEYFDTSAALPPGRLVINLIGDADLCGQGLDIAESLLANTRLPVINHPKSVRNTGRLENAHLLGNLPGVITPRMELMPRKVLLSNNAETALADSGFGFPLLLRSPGFHTGQFFQRVETAKELPAILAGLPGEHILVMRELDTRNLQGDFHKYRVMFVDGELYPLHLAISKHWKIHYFSADMDINPDYRSMEAAFLENMPAVLGEKAMTALHAIRQTLQLDYGGMDFALSSEGDILLFEANATMAAHRPDEHEIWAYRRTATERVLDAVRGMVIKRARQS